MSRPIERSATDVAADLACAISRPGPLPDMLHRCADALARHLPAALVQIWGLNAAEDALLLQASAPEAPDTRTAVPVRGSTPGRIVGERRPAVTHRVPTDPGLPDAAWVRRHRVTAFAGYPLIVDDRAIGALAVFTRRQVDDLEPVARLIAVGMERKQLEDRLRQAEAFEAVGRAAAGLAHDLNNLMTLVAGYGELVRPLLPADSRAVALTEDLSQVATRAAGIAGRLVALGRPTVATVLDFNAAVADQVSLVRRLVGPRVHVVLRLGPEVGRVRAEAGLLEQVLLNLSANARDAMPDGGTLTIQTSGVPADERNSAQQFARLTVTDTGKGMDAATRARLFEPYFTTKPPGRGTGLGLVSVRQIIRRAGGRVSVDSEPGRGTTVDIDLPKVDDTSVGGVTEVSDGGSDRPHTVLVTENDAATRALTRFVLARSGYAVLEAADGPAALNIADGHPGPIHLLITDLLLPGMTGRRLADRLVARRPGLKVLYLSALGADAVTAGEPGVKVLAKPFDPADLTRAVGELLSR